MHLGLFILDLIHPISCTVEEVWWLSRQNNPRYHQLMSLLTWKSCCLSIANLLKILRITHNFCVVAINQQKKVTDVKTYFGFFFSQFFFLIIINLKFMFVWYDKEWESMFSFSFTDGTMPKVEWMSTPLWVGKPLALESIHYVSPTKIW